MKKYTVDVIIDGWARLKVEAPSRDAVYDLLEKGNLELRFRNKNLETNLIDSEFFVEVEEVESVQRKNKVSAYHKDIDKTLEAISQEEAAYNDYFYSDKDD